MQTAGLKTFIYSFSVSLFAIFVANGVYLHTRPSDIKHSKIPTKNVTLFLKDAALNPSLRPAPVKKIALSVLPELEKNKDIALQAGDIVYEPPADEVIMADNFIPLESIELLETKNSPEQIEFIPSPKEPSFVLASADVKNVDHITIPRQAPQIPVQKNPSFSVATKDDIQKEVLTATPSKKDSNPEKPALIANGNLPLPIFPLEKTHNAEINGRKIKIGEADALNQVALTDKNIPISSMENKKSAPPPPEWEQMRDKEADSPWIVAKGAGASKNALLKQEDHYRKENEQIKEALLVSSATDDNKSANLQIASDTVKNLLIPIPEDILNDDNLVPQLSYSSNDKEKKIGEKNIQKEDKSSPLPLQAESDAPSKQPEKQVKDNILASLNTIFSSNTKVKEQKEPEPQKRNLFSDLKKKLSSSKKVTIMPTEMRLSFQPNRAEISGQTLRWIQAFAARAAEDNTMTIEIRIDGTSGMELQQKRLNLLHNILTNKGVEYSKINTVFTSREPNSFIIRTVTRNFDRRGLNKNNTQTAGRYLQW